MAQINPSMLFIGAGVVRNLKIYFGRVAASIKAEELKKTFKGQSQASLLLPVSVEVKLVQGLGRGRV